MNIELGLSRTVDPVLAMDIEKESVFVSPFLERIRVSSDRARVTAELRDQANQEEVLGKVDRFLDAMLRRLDGFETKVFVTTRRRDDGPYTADTHAELIRRGWLHDYGRGCVALNGPALTLARLIDERAAQAYVDTFQAASLDFPALVEAEVLWRCGYFDSHPNTACFVGHVVEDFDAIEEFRAANTQSASPVLPAAEHVHQPGLCLNPAACFPFYPTLEGETLGDEGRVVTWRGRVFRFESRNVSGLDRLWEFNVREIVFAGSEAFANSGRHRSMPLIAELAEWLDLDCQVETASDPFFATVSAAKTFWQQSTEVKNEIMLPVGLKADGSSRRLACGSINLHGNFFGDRFDFKHDDNAAFTACIGLGIERWVLGAFCQHGFDQRRWPKHVRERIFD